MYKVLLINGSPHSNGCTATALNEMINILEDEGIETKLIHVGNKNIRGCISCNSCSQKGRCVFDDMVNETAADFESFARLRVINAAEAAEMLGCSRQYINDLVKNDKLTPIKASDKSTLFLRSEVMKRLWE